MVMAPTTPVRTTRPWIGYAGFAWAASYIPIHVYWALGGLSSSIGIVTSTAQLRAANWGASLVILGAGLTCLALAQPWGAVLPRAVRHGTAWVGAVVALGHFLVFGVATALRLGGMIGYPVDPVITTDQMRAYDWANLLYFEPWFGVMGVLLIACSRSARRREHAAGADGPVAPQWMRQAGWPRPAATAALGIAALVHAGWAFGSTMLLAGPAEAALPRLVDLGQLGPYRIGAGVVAVLLTALAAAVARSWGTAWRRGATALTLAALFAVVWGVFTFDVWTFAGYGPALLANGVLTLLAHLSTVSVPTE